MFPFYSTGRNNCSTSIVIVFCWGTSVAQYYCWETFDRSWIPPMLLWRVPWQTEKRTMEGNLWIESWPNSSAWRWLRCPLPFFSDLTPTIQPTWMAHAAQSGKCGRVWMVRRHYSRLHYKLFEKFTRFGTPAPQDYMPSMETIQRAASLRKCWYSRHLPVWAMRIPATTEKGSMPAVIERPLPPVFRGLESFGEKLWLLVLLSTWIST